MKSDDQGSPRSAATNVVDLSAFRRQKSTADELTRGGRRPLYVSHGSGQISGLPGTDQATPAAEGAHFGDRLQRIRSSLEKINRLMSDLRRMSTEQQDGIETSDTGSKSKGSPPVSRQPR